MKRNLLLVIAWVIVSCSFASAQVVRDLSFRPDVSDPYVQERCLLDIYAPEGAEDLPVVVWFHGGGLTGGNKTSVPRDLRESGYVVVSAGYRLIPRGTVADCLDDAAAAVAWTFRHVAEYGGSPDKIFLSGHSAGGYLIDLLGLDKRWLAKYGIDADSVAGLIPFSGQVLTHYSHRKTLGMTPYQPLIDEYAPLAHVRADAPPIVIISGDRELELYGRYEETAYFWRLLRMVGHPDATLYELQGFNHGNMAAPAVQILKDHVKRILQK
ncbi:MAG: alpha/beta hydrolase [Bacteroidales bacterium]|nr:alpha/beta hydrolase [Bacteroidales bacterium]